MAPSFDLSDAKTALVSAKVVREVLCTSTRPAIEDLGVAPLRPKADSTRFQEQMIASAPTGTNPWLTVQMYLTAQVQWDVDNSFKVQLYILSGVLIVAPLTLICSLWVRWRQGELWLFKIMRGEGGAYIVPHYLTAFS